MLIADALRHRCCDYSVDSAWMGATHDSWRTVLAGSIHRSNMNRRLAAGGSFKAIEAAPAADGHRDDKPADQAHNLISTAHVLLLSLTGSACLSLHAKLIQPTLLGVNCNTEVIAHRAACHMIQKAVDGL